MQPLTQVHLKNQLIKEIEGITFLYTLKSSIVTITITNDEYKVRRQHTINKTLSMALPLATASLGMSLPSATASLRMAKDSVYIFDGVAVIETVVLGNTKINISYYTNIYDGKTLPVTVQIIDFVVQETKSQQEVLVLSLK